MATSYKFKDPSTEEFRQSLLCSGFPSWLLKNASAELNLGGSAVRNFIIKAQEYAGNSTGFERLAKLTEFVYKYISYDDDKQAYPVFEEVLSRKSGGVCLHKASALQLVLVYEGWNVKAERGIVTYRELLLGNHAWLRITLGEEDYLSDPTRMLVGKYSDFKISRTPVRVFQKITEDKRFFGLLRKEKQEIEIAYENLGDWYPWGLGDARKVPGKVPEEVTRAYSEFIRTAERIKSIVEQHGTMEDDFLAISIAYSKWVSASIKKLNELKRLARNQ